MLVLATLSGCEEKPKSALDDLPYWKWKHVSNIDPITDLESVSAVLSSGPLGDGSFSPAELHYRCKGGVFEVYVAWNRYVGTDRQVTSRIDKDPASTSSWGWSEDGKVSFYSGNSVELANRLALSKSFYVRISAVGGELTARFDNPGIISEVSDVRQKCGN
ncbi:hypothetical protein [Pseudomonas faucium]|uniref:hypothetical protein n=1 Tax=Pseudomonas faucium TaxID=2740518 RepID=UPI001F370CDA|nr:hypothetical protein [Pseudomonas faucium]